MASKKKAARTPAKKKAARKKAAAKKAHAKPSARNAGPAKHVTKRSARAAKPGELAERLTQAVEPELELAFRSPFELLVATMLAAQSTDRTVNQVMPALMKRYPHARALAASQQEEVEPLILRTGFFGNKAKAIRGAAQALVDRHGGEVPDTMEGLVGLPGVARKTANVVLGTGFGIGAGFIVDTHVMRVAQRLALTRQTDPVKIERELCAAFPQDQWVDQAHRFTLHGRYTCLAKNPMCSACPLNELCPSRLAEAEGDWRLRAARERERTHEGVRASRGH